MIITPFRNSLLRKQYCGLFLILIVLMAFPTSNPASSFSQSIELAKQLVAKGSLTNSSDAVIEGYRIFQDLYQQNPKPEILYMIAHAEYELVRLGVSDKTNKLYDIYINQALERTGKLKKKYPNQSEVYALSSALHSYRIAHNPINAVSAGPKAYLDSEEAVKLDSLNPRAWLVRGVIRLNMPEVFGGSDDVAMESFKRSISLFESNPKSALYNPTWGYIDALVWLGWAYQRKDQISLSINYYSKALAQEPQARWIQEKFLNKLLEIK